MNTDSNEQSQLTEADFLEISQRKHLSYSQYYLVLLRGLMRQFKMTREQAELMARSRYPMSTHAAVEEVATRGLRVSLADVEEFWFDLHETLIDSDRLQWSAMALEAFIEWAIDRNRAQPIEAKTPFIQKLLRDREFVTVAHEIDIIIQNQTKANHI